MKKLISGALLFTMLSTNIAYAMPNDSTLSNINMTQSIASDIFTSQTVTVNDFSDLKQYKNTSDVTININANITLDEKIEMTGKNVIINGNGHEIDINESSTSTGNKFVIKGTNVSISNISIKNYVTSGILLYNAKNISMSDIKLIGNETDIADDKSKVGIDLSNSTSSLKNIDSKNHRYSGVRLRNQSEITLEGGNTHSNDASDLESQVASGAADNKITDDNSTYTKWQDKVNNGTTSAIYKVKTIATANTIDEFKAAIKIPNSIITLSNNITLDENIEINQKDIVIEGNGKEIDLNGQFTLTVKAASNVRVDDVTIKNYKSTGLTIYSANNVELNNIELIGKDVSLPKDERSTVGLDIYNSQVKLNNIVSKNHLYRGIQVRKESTVDILSVNVHDNDAMHMQSIIAAGENPSTINDSAGAYLPGNKYTEGNNEKIDYFAQKNITINSVADLKNNIKNSGNVLTLNSDLKVEASDLNPGSDKLELELASSIVINGNGKVIDFNNLGNITLKGKDITLMNVTIKNANSHAVDIYNSKNALLDTVKVENSARTGIFVNGSSVKLQNCTTMNNTEGGISITRSRTLLGSGYSDSYVEVVGTIKQEESNINVNVKNLEMTDGHIQDNKFIYPSDTYDKYENDKEYKVLSDYYLDYFNIQGEDRKKKYQEQDIDYMVIKQVIDVTKNTEVLDENGAPIQLVCDGVTDETEKIQKLIEYAASHGRELYFPQGTYKITRDIDLSQIKLPALSNFKLSGDKNGLSIFDATSSTEKMLKLMHADYKGAMNYVEIENIVFNNMGVEINGPYKKGIIMKNNTFMNGKYTTEKGVDGSILRIIMEPYITVLNSKYIVENNIFLRGANYPGRGVSTFATKNTSISNNFFGDLDGADDAAKMLPAEVSNRLSIIKSSNLASGNQGNFFTAVNNERHDTNMLISNNYFNMMKTRDIVSDFSSDIAVEGLDVPREGQRRDHIIYSKSFDNLNIASNYFKGMENDASGGVKLRNGNNAYIGANYFDDVPLLTYIYSDLSKEDTLLYNTVIYNNLFHAKTNFGEEGTGILYYQSFRDGDNLEFDVKNADGTVTKDVWENAYGDVKNYIIYKNEFLSDDRDQITISNRAQTAYKNNEFLAYGNIYSETSKPVNFDKGNLSLTEVSEELILSKVNSGYNTHKDRVIPLTPAKVDYTYLKEIMDEANGFYEYIFDNDLIGSLSGKYSKEVAEELKALLDDVNNLMNLGTLNQGDTNKSLTSIKETLEKLKNSINSNGDAPVVEKISNLEIKKGDKVNFMEGLTITDDRDTLEQLDIKIDSGDFDSSVPGIYTIKYTVTDRDGNVITFTRKIKVVEDIESTIPEADDDVDMDKPNQGSGSNEDNSSDEDNNLNLDNNFAENDNSDKDNNLNQDNNLNEDQNLSQNNNQNQSSNLNQNNNLYEDNVINTATSEGNTLNNSTNNSDTSNNVNDSINSEDADSENSDYNIAGEIKSGSRIFGAVKGIVKNPFSWLFLLLLLLLLLKRGKEEEED